MLSTSRMIELEDLIEYHEGELKKARKALSEEKLKEIHKEAQSTIDSWPEWKKKYVRDFEE